MHWSLNEEELAVLGWHVVASPSDPTLLQTSNSYNVSLSIQGGKELTGAPVDPRRPRL